MNAEELKEILNRIWDRIAMDILVDDEGRPDESATATRQEVFSITVDQWCGGLDRDSKEWKWWCDMSREEREALPEQCFSNEIYGY